MSLHSHKLLHLDPSIRDWVVIPMFLMLIIVGVGRQYMSALIKSHANQLSDAALNGEHRQKQIVGASQRLRGHANYLSDAVYAHKKAFFLHKTAGVLNEALPTTPPNPMLSNPNAMMDMMKGNLVFMVPNFAMMTFVSSFFAGFICLKLPFPLPSNRFKVMLQRDVDLRFTRWTCPMCRRCPGTSW